VRQGSRGRERKSADISALTARNASGIRSYFWKYKFSHNISTWPGTQGDSSLVKQIDYIQQQDFSLKQNFPSFLKDFFKK
jgi:hypothetical protein